jgi:phosphomannomutase
VAVDCCNGAASIATPEFLRELGCEVVELNTNPDEPFPHGPEPVPENIGALGEIVRGSKADVGFAQDADADRVAIVSERGEAIGEDCTVSLGIYHWLRRHPGPVVVNVSTSRMVDDIAASHGCEVHRTRVGEINVVEAMLRSGSEIGGEGNGGIVLSRVHPCRDSFVGMALVLEALALEGTTVSELRSRIPTYAMLSEKLICPARDIVPSLRLLRKLYHEETLDLTDGVKVIWPDRWLHARPSTTEPVIRLHAEAPTRPEARELLQGALECLSPTL